MSELFGAVFARGRTAETVSDAAWIEAMLRAEAASAHAAARLRESLENLNIHPEAMERNLREAE